MFDYLDETQERLIDQVKAVCKALKYIRSVTALDTLPHLPDGSENPKYTEWCRQMGIAGRARVDMEMARGAALTPQRARGCLPLPANS